jgi:hypothetical protein
MIRFICFILCLTCMLVCGQIMTAYNLECIPTISYALVFLVGVSLLEGVFDKSD